MWKRPLQSARQRRYAQSQLGELQETLQDEVDAFLPHWLGQPQLSPVARLPAHVGGPKPPTDRPNGLLRTGALYILSRENKNTAAELTSNDKLNSQNYGAF